MSRLSHSLLELIEAARELVEAVGERVESYGELIALLLGLAQRGDRARHVVIARRQLEQIITSQEREVEDRRDHADQHAEDETVDESHRALPHRLSLRTVCCAPFGRGT